MRYPGHTASTLRLLSRTSDGRALVRLRAIVCALCALPNDATDKDDLLRRVCRIAVECGEFTAATIHVRADVGGHLAANFGDRRAVEYGRLRPPNFRTKGRLARRIAIRSVLIPGVTEGNRDSVAITLALGRKDWGLLTLFAEDLGNYDHEELHFLATLAAGIDSAIHAVEGARRLRRLAHHNHDTNFPNHLALRDNVAAPIGRGRPVVMVALVVHRFGRIMDERGRLYPASLLRQIGGSLSTAFRGAWFAHVSENLFYLAYPLDRPIDQEVLRLGELLRHVERQPLIVDGELVSVVLRCGVAASPGHGLDFEGLEGSAMAALDEGARSDLRICAFDGESKNARSLNGAP